MRMIAFVVGGLVWGLLSVAEAAPSFTDSYRVRVVAGFYTGEYESLALRQVASSAGTFWMAERRKRTTAGITGPTIRIERQWIDGRRCPGLATVVESIAAIPPPPKPTGTIPPFHGASVYLGALGAGGAYAVRWDYEGPVTAWWRQTQDALKPCWGSPIVMVDAALLPLTLERDADEEPYRALERAP